MHLDLREENAEWKVWTPEEQEDMARGGHGSLREKYKKYGRREYNFFSPYSLSKKSGWSWAFSDRYGRMDKGDERYWNAGKWIEIW